jgi:hypothetical protein
VPILVPPSARGYSLVDQLAEFEAFVRREHAWHKPYGVWLERCKCRRRTSRRGRLAVPKREEGLEIVVSQALLGGLLDGASSGHVELAVR